MAHWFSVPVQHQVVTLGLCQSDQAQQLVVKVGRLQLPLVQATLKREALSLLVLEALLPRLGVLGRQQLETPLQGQVGLFHSHPAHPQLVELGEQLQYHRVHPPLLLEVG